MMLIIFRIENYDIIEIIAHCENFAIQVAIYSVFFCKCISNSVYYITYYLYNKGVLWKFFLQSRCSPDNGTA